MPRRPPPGRWTSTRRTPRSRRGTSTRSGPTTPSGCDEAATDLEADLAAHDDPEEAAFAARFRLVHEWRKFLFTDPGLPDQLLPRDWAGRRASDYFRREADRLAPASEAFVARTLASA